MKKLLAMVLTVSMTAAMVGCGQAAETTETAAESTAVETVESTAAEETATESAEESTAAEEAAGDVLSYADYVAADLDSEVTIESYVQAKQSWWEDKATVYTQDKDGAYFLYDMACSEEDYEKLVPGVKIRVTGYKSEWSGEVELMDATFEFVEGADEYIAPAVDVTDLLGTDELIDHQNQHVILYGSDCRSGWSGCRRQRCSLSVQLRWFPVLRAMTCTSTFPATAKPTPSWLSLICVTRTAMFTRLLKICRSVIPSMQKASCTGTRV